MRTAALRALPSAVTCTALLLLAGGCGQQQKPLPQIPDIAVLPASAPTVDPTVLSQTGKALQKDVNAGNLAALNWPDFKYYQPQVKTFYAQRAWLPAWLVGRQPTAQAVELIQLFRKSARKGLHPEDYDAALWLGRLQHLSQADASTLAEFDLALSICAMRYISNLHSGRVNPAYFSFAIDVGPKRYDLARFLTEKVVPAPSVSDALPAIESNSAQYRALEAELIRYGRLAKEAALNSSFPWPNKPLNAGDPYEAAPDLAIRLVQLGDLRFTSALAAGAAPARGAKPVYTQQIANAIRHFQTRYDLPADGVLDGATLQALDTPAARYLPKIEDTLERLRWLSPESLSAPLVVNIPEYKLRVYNPNRQLAFAMRVIVGRSEEEDHQTPLMAEQMQYLVFRPYWIVTPSIIRQDLVPKLEADPNYLDEQNFEVVTRSNGRPVTHWTVDDLAKNRFMVREKPGPDNSLGLVKFMFPNKLNIYLHSTSAAQLFYYPRRDFSHGCVRLQNPEELADWILRDDPGWTPEKIHEAMENGRDNQGVTLKQTVPVLLFYATARVSPDGAIHFFEDVYGYDRELESVLANGAPYPQKPRPKKHTADTV